MTWKREEAVDVEAVCDMGEVGVWNDLPSEAAGKCLESDPCKLQYGADGSHCLKATWPSRRDSDKLL